MFTRIVLYPKDLRKIHSQETPDLQIETAQPHDLKLNFSLILRVSTKIPDLCNKYKYRKKPVIINFHPFI